MTHSKLFQYILDKVEKQHPIVSKPKSVDRSGMFEIKRYTHEFADEWNGFVKRSKNGTFLIDRSYMDYHSERYHDYSLMVYRKGRLYAILPANRFDGVLYSHQGLTCGGLIMSSDVTTADVIVIFDLINEYLKKDGVSRVIYKPMPPIYHLIPAQEDLYALFRIDAKIIERNISSTIYQNRKIRFYKMRKVAVRKANENHLVIRESDDYDSFWKILCDNLKTNHKVSPIHSLSEISLLHSRFPDNIKLYLAYKGDEILGGVLIYITTQVVHAQYCSATPEGKALGALDLLFDYLINNKYIGFPIFDFGKSTTQMGMCLNEGLIFQKEGFGARATVYDVYEYEIK